MNKLRLAAALAVAALLMAACSPWSPDVAATPGGNQPGWTGRTQIVGNNSSIASNADATYIQQKWGVGRER
jgi:outer membrane biogenesis lipoprotein LolB